MAVVERFEAWCQCPSCGVLACHRLRRPKLPAPIAPWERKLGRDSRPIQERTPNWDELPVSIQLARMQMDRIDQIGMSFTLCDSTPKDPRAWTSNAATAPLRGAVMIADYKPPNNADVARTAAASLFNGKPEPLREFEYEIIRMCECGREWGQV